jgi:hypothetical protein
MVKGTCLVAWERKTGTLEGLVLEVLEERLRHSVTKCEANTSSQSTKYNKHVLNEYTE